MKKEDLRSIKTKKSIKESFIELVEIKGYNKVSVSDIVNKAQINRNTFYLHYQDKEDLAKKILADVSENMNVALGTYVYTTKSSMAKITETEIRWGFRNLLNLIEPEIELYRIILLDESLNGYINKTFNMIKKHIAYLLDIKNPRSNLIYEYAFSGMIGVIQQWIIYSPNSASKTAMFLAKLAYSNLQQFKTIN